MTITTPQPATAPRRLNFTASMQTDPEARHHGDAASVSSPAQAFPIETARCATSATQLEWVPDREHRVVPDAVAALCRRCPGRQNCLLWALAGKEQGYWAGTTTNDREMLRQLGQDDIDTADWLQDLTYRALTDGARHAPGDGSYFWYRRRGCRCGECKSANARARAQERAKVKKQAA